MEPGYYLLWCPGAGTFANLADAAGETLAALNHPLERVIRCNFLRRGSLRRPGDQFLSRGHPWGDTSIGKVNQKVEPRPGALWTPTCPWCCSTMALTMANPSPNPLSGPTCPGAAT